MYDFGNILVLKDGRTVVVYMVQGDKYLVTDCDNQEISFYVEKNDVIMQIL
jgi:hypothetical protein